MSFYKLDNDTLLVAPNIVHGPSYDLNKEYKDTYTYPVGDWYWFDTLEDANIFFNIPEPSVDTEVDPDLPIV